MATSQYLTSHKHPQLWAKFPQIYQEVVETHQTIAPNKPQCPIIIWNKPQARPSNQTNPSTQSLHGINPKPGPPT